LSLSSSSSGYCILDCRLPNAGIISATSTINITLNANINANMNTNTIITDFYKFQTYTKSFCKDDNDKRTCIQGLAESYRYLLTIMMMKELSLPMIQILPSSSSPFVFLHIDKCAGTSMRYYHRHYHYHYHYHHYLIREYIYESSLVLGVKTYIPCYGNISCAVFDVHDDDNDDNGIAVLAGHFPWDIWNKLPTYKNTNTNPPCFVMGRNPVDRAISYYYQRCYN